MYRTIKITFCVTLLFSAAAFSQDTRGTEREIKSASEELVPLSQMKPLEVGEGYKNKHTFLYGLSAANTFIVDTNSLPKGYFLGNYRPYFKYLWHEEHVFNVRGKVAYKNNPSVTDAQEKAGVYRSTGEYSMELLNAELHFDKHEITAGRAFYKLGRGLLFSNFADGAEYTGNFKYVTVKAMAAYSGQYNGCTISLGGLSFNSQGIFKLGHTIALSVSGPKGSEAIDVEGQIVWMSNNNQYGVKFKNADEQSLVKINEWSKKLKKAD